MCPQVESTVETCPGSSSAIVEEEQEYVKHWIEFGILDENKNPISDVTLQVLSSDNSEAKVGKSNENGLIQINNLEPGDYKIESDWKDVVVYDAVLIKS